MPSNGEFENSLLKATLGNNSQDLKNLFNNNIPIDILNKTFSHIYCHFTLIWLQSFVQVQTTHPLKYILEKPQHGYICLQNIIRIV